MKADLILALLLVGSTPAWMIAADVPDTPEPKTNMKEALRARVAEDARKKSAPPAAAETAKPTAPNTESIAKPAVASSGTVATPVVDGRKAEANPGTSKAPATVLPTVEVKKGRSTVLDQKLAQQEQDIAR